MDASDDARFIAGSNTSRAQNDAGNKRPRQNDSSEQPKRKRTTLQQFARKARKIAADMPPAANVVSIETHTNAQATLRRFVEIYRMKRAQGVLRTKHACNIDKTTAKTVAGVFGVDPRLLDALEGDVCEFVFAQLPLKHLRYRATGIAGQGSYGLVMNAVSEQGQEMVLKVCRVARDPKQQLPEQPIDMLDQGVVWRGVDQNEFMWGTRMQQKLSRVEWPPGCGVPKIDAAALVQTQSTNRNERLGISIMPRVQGMPLHSTDLLPDDIRKLGTLVNFMHGHLGYTHGDLHLGNILISKDSHTLWLIDFDRSIPTKELFTDPDDSTMLLAAQSYDIVHLLIRLSPEQRKYFKQTYYTGIFKDTHRVAIHSTSHKQLWDMYQGYLAIVIQFT